MANILFFGLPFHGHTYQALALTQELVRRGEKVIYYSTGAFENDVRLSGARYRAYPSTFLHRLSSTPFTPEWSYLWMKATLTVLNAELERIRDDAPDCIIYDGLAFWGKYVSTLLDVPALTSISTCAFNQSVLRLVNRFSITPTRLETQIFSRASIGSQLSSFKFLARAAEIREQIERKYRVQGPGPTLQNLCELREDLNIVYTSKLFQPFAETFDHSFKFVGRSPLVCREDADFPWDRVSHRTLVYVSLGTTFFNRDRDFFQMCFDALADLDCQVVVSTGLGLTPESLKPAPANVLLQPYVPQTGILERCAACVTNGGLNTVSDSLYYGVPVVAIPQHGEQSLQARRIRELGAGVHLERRHASSQTLRQAIEEILGQARYRRQCKLVGDSFREAGGATKAAGHILRFMRLNRQNDRRER